MLNRIGMRHLRMTSLALSIAGLALLLAGVAFNLSETVQLVGLMLVLSGVVKVVVVHLWQHVAHFETDRHKPIPPA